MLLLAAAGPASAHRQREAGGSTAGISIPSVTHGQMSVLADNRSAILALADQQYPTDETMRRLQSFINLQHFVCALGLVPGSLSDERSSFNECTHADLAGVRALLLHLQVMPGEHSKLRALSRKIDIEMLEQHASLVLCRFSDEPFNTADVVFPGLLPSHPPSLLTFFVVSELAILLGWVGWRRFTVAAE